MTPRKDVQMHHIDGKPGNNQSANLAVVCLDCHSLVSGTRGLGRQYGAGEVRKHKRTWEQAVAAQRRVYKPPSRALQRELIGQVDLVICQILAAQEHARRKELLDLLVQLHLWRGTPKIDKQIVEGFGHLAVMSGLGIPRLARVLAVKTWELCWHFVGPHQVAMDSSDMSLVIASADVIESLASYNCIDAKNVAVLNAALATAEKMFDIALWYKREKIARAVLLIYAESLKCCSIEEQVEFAEGKRALLNSARRIARKLRDSHLKWLTVDRKLRQIVPHRITDYRFQIVSTAIPKSVKPWRAAQAV
jgi:hypothetical protein